MPPAWRRLYRPCERPLSVAGRASGRDERGLRRHCRLAVVVGGWLSNDSFYLARCAWLHCPSGTGGMQYLSRRFFCPDRAAAAFRGDDRRPLQQHRLPLPRWALVAVGRGDDAAGHDVIVLRAGRRCPPHPRHSELPGEPSPSPQRCGCSERRDESKVGHVHVLLKNWRALFLFQELNTRS